MSFVPTKAEVQSKYDRVQFAEGLIRQLPANHDGRNTWLLNYGASEEACKLRSARGIAWANEHAAAETTR